MYLSSLVEVDKATSYVVWVAIGDEGEVLEEHTDVGNSWDWCDVQFITIVLIVTLRNIWRGIDGHMTHL